MAETYSRQWVAVISQRMVSLWGSENSLNLCDSTLKPVSLLAGKSVYPNPLGILSTRIYVQTLIEVCMWN